MPFFPNSTYNPLCMLSCSVMSDSLQLHGLWPTRLLCPWDFTGKNTAVGCHFLLQGIFLHLLHSRVDSSPSEPPGKPWSYPNMGVRPWEPSLDTPPSPAPPTSHTGLPEGGSFQMASSKVKFRCCNTVSTFIANGLAAFSSFMA